VDVGMDVGRILIVGWMYGWMCLYLTCGWVDVWTNVSLGVWCLGGCVGRRVVVVWMCGWKCHYEGSVYLNVWMNMSVGVWWLVGCVDGCVVSSLVVG